MHQESQSPQPGTRKGILESVEELERKVDQLMLLVQAHGRWAQRVEEERAQARKDEKTARGWARAAGGMLGVIAFDRLADVLPWVVSWLGG